MKFLVLGGSGMAGHTISLYLKESGHEVIAFTQKKINFCENIVGDIRDFNNTRHIIETEKFDAIINAIGVLNESAENNKTNGVILNSYLPHFLSEVTKSMKTKIIHMSTDCVFSGKAGGYSETSIRDGESFYDRSKALGELENKKDLTFRNSIIGPDMNDNGIGLFNWFMKQDGSINGYSKAIWTGVTTLTLAKAMEKAIEEDVTGLYHLVNNDIISKYELLKIFNKNFKKNQIEIIPQDKVIIDKSLINNRNDFSFKVPDYEIMIQEMRNWINIHKNFYPHYFL